MVKDMLNKTMPASKKRHKAKLQELRENSGWEMLSLEEAIIYLEGMPQPPSLGNLVCILNKCKKERKLAYALRLHAYMHEKELEGHRSLGNNLLSVLVEVGSMCNAQQVFDRLVYRDDFSWYSLITGYIKSGELQHALILYQKMQKDSVHPSGYTFVALLKACAKLKDVETGHKLHAHITRKGLERDLFVGSTLVDMYAKCGLLAKAQEVFDKLHVRDVVLWNALISGYAKHGCGEEALNCFEQMRLEGVSPNTVTYVFSLKACGSIRATDKGQEIHAEIARKGLLDKDVSLGSTLVEMYANFGLLPKAQEVFDKLPVRDAVSWNALITGYVRQGSGGEALNCFDQMRLYGICPDAVTFVCSLKACSSIGASDKGQEIHAEIARQGLLYRSLIVGNALLDMYASCGLLTKAQEVFDNLIDRDVVSWTALIAGYAKHGCNAEALYCFELMQLEGVSPDAGTFVCSLKACGSIGAADKGEEIHAEISRKGLERDLVVGNALVDMYVNCGLLAKAQEVLDKLLVRNAVSWTALIAGYAKHGHGQEALNCFEQMQLEGVSPDAFTFVCSLKACGSIGAAAKGEEIHAEIARKGFLERGPFVGSALVNMYASCGFLAKAQEVFEKLSVQDDVSWTAILTGYAQLGDSENVFHMFDRMRQEGIKPNLITLQSVLNACSHAGLLDNGQTYFEAMSEDYGITPTLEHYTCMVDLLGRAGQFDKVVAIIKKMPFHPNLVVWHAVLGACRKWGNVELGRQAFENAVGLDERDDAAYFCMFNIYADAGMHQDAKKVDRMRLQKQASKKLGYCWWTDSSGIGRSIFSWG